MREIKFRAWDKISKKMYYNGNLENGDILVLTLEGKLQFSNDDETYKEKDFVLMQYTGLKGNNGKEIYEGDIFRYENLGGASMPFTSTVICVEGRFQPEYWKHSDYSLGRISRYCEVIGNIYENQELLKEKAI